jgi:uncharacterized membrane protein YeaQ/YmgE (transglycosylase-associated protein family)
MSAPRAWGIFEVRGLTAEAVLGYTSRRAERLAVGTLAREENHMHLLWTLLIGLVIGAVAKFIMPGKDPGGIIVTMLIGIAGSFVATWAGRAIGWYQEGQAAGFIMSVVGAIVLLGLYHLVKPKTN